MTQMNVYFERLAEGQDRLLQKLYQPSVYATSPNIVGSPIVAGSASAEVSVTHSHILHDETSGKQITVSL